MSERLLRLPSVLDRLPFGRTTIYERIAGGLFPKPVRLSERMSAWRESDVDGVVSALIRGATDDELRHLVSVMSESRKAAA